MLIIRLDLESNSAVLREGLALRYTMIEEVGGFAINDLSEIPSKWPTLQFTSQSYF